MQQRWIVHIDMDAFFAAVEQRDNPDYRGKPLIVGGLGKRGVVSTASYEARRFGVQSAMPMYEAKRRCPQAIFLWPDHDKYSRVSDDIHGILSDFSPVIERLSLDEAFLDISGMEWLYSGPLEIARRIKERIKTEIGLTASAGVASSKFIAKLASDYKKPDGLVIVYPGQEMAFLKEMPIGRLWGVGRVTAQLMKQIGINTIGELAQADIELLRRHFGNAGYELKKLALGQDKRLVVPDHDPKSVGNEMTFECDLTTAQHTYPHLLAMAEKIGWRLRKLACSGRTVTVKIRFASFKTITRSRTLAEPTNIDEVIYENARDIINQIAIQEGIRLVGIAVSNLQAGQGQESLFPDVNDKRMAVLETVDKLKDKFGEKIVTRGTLLLENPANAKP